MMATTVFCFILFVICITRCDCEKCIDQTERYVCFCFKNVLECLTVQRVDLLISPPDLHNIVINYTSKNVTICIGLLMFVRLLIFLHKQEVLNFNVISL